jgi:bifunctional UDP-N-acetylglucosamine pyrophosphorylase/glucosamine-1-phosphate N-acetyltransferase
MLVVIVLAAGEGKRMRSNLTKVLHLCGGKPMLVRVIETARGLNPDKIIVVTGRHHVQIKGTIEQWNHTGIVYINQLVPMGTGHAVQYCLPEISTEDQVFILNGDIPLIKTELLKKVLTDKDTIITAKIENPHGYGRIVYDEDKFTSIVEEKDCTDEQRMIREINSGIYLFSGKSLHSFLPKITNKNKQNEYYLTDIVKIAIESGNLIHTFILDEKDNYQIKGANTPEELNELNLLKIET